MNAGADVDWLIYGYPMILELVLCMDYIDRLKGLELFIKARADVNAKDLTGRTPLMRLNSWPWGAIRLNAAELLLDGKADVNLKDNNNNTALMYAIDDRFIDMMKILLKNGADVNVVNLFGQTPLILAASRCSNMCLMLIQLGADINVKDSNNNTPMDIAIQSKKTDIIVVLKQAYNFSMVVKNLLLFSKKFEKYAHPSNISNVVTGSSTEFYVAGSSRGHLPLTKFQ